MEFVEAKNQSNIISPCIKKAIGSFISWAMLAQSYLGYGMIQPSNPEKVITEKNYSTVVNLLKTKPKEQFLSNVKETFFEKKETVKEEISKTIRKKNTKEEKGKVKPIISKNRKAKTTYTSTLKKGTIGSFGERKLDNPVDNIFHINLDRKPLETDRVWLEYELNGLANTQSVSKSINDRLGTGGYLIKKAKGWTQQREIINPQWLKQGDNTVLFSLPEEASYGYQVKNIRLVVEETTIIPKLMLNSSNTIYNGKAYLQGFVQEEASQAVILVDGNPVINQQGEFETILKMDQPRSVEVTVILSNGKQVSETVHFTQRDQVDYVYTKSEAQSVSKLFKKHIANQLKIQGAELEVSNDALKENRTVSIIALRDIDLPALNIGMTNTTKGFNGYRFLPRGEHFKKKALVKIAYDRTKIPNGYTENDIRTYFFDRKAHCWIALKRDSIDKKNQVIISKTTHFTDMVNGVIKAPESPESKGFVPTEMTDIKVSEPSTKIQQIQTPKVSQLGNATTSYHFELPPSRNEMTPDLKIEYNSDGESGWLGEGWNLHVPSIKIDTRWGVPQYNSTYETETYDFDGEMLAMMDEEGNSAVAHKGDLIKRKNNRRFYLRTTDPFSKIIRKGNDTDHYTWEITDKKGTIYTYGGNGGSLTGKAVDVSTRRVKDVVAQWNLSRVEEIHGDWIEYHYETNEEEVQGNLTSKAQYLSRIEVGLKGQRAHTTIEFNSKNKKERKTNNARYGFLISNHQLLDLVTVKFEGKTLRSYGFEYETGAFSKKLLNKIIQYNSKGEEFNHHELNYYNDVSYENGGYKPFKSKPENWNTQYDGVMSILGPPTSISGTESYGLGFGVSVSNDFPYNGDLSCKGSVSVGGTLNFSASRSNGKLILSDINGDGLPDKVYKQLGLIWYRPNLSTHTDFQRYTMVNDTDPIKKIYGNVKPVRGSLSFLKSFNASLGLGLNLAYTDCTTPLGVNAGVDISTSGSLTDIYFQDVNGDGLTDIVNRGLVLFNTLDKETGNIQFTPNSGKSASPIAGGEKIRTSELIQEDVEEVWKTNVENNPLHDVVRVWEAPFDGIIKIDGNPTLIKPKGTPGEDYDIHEYNQSDGVLISIDMGTATQNTLATRLWSQKLTKSVHSTSHSIQGKSIKKGQRIYFRIQSGDNERANGAFDDVNWNPTITYTKTNKANQTELNDHDIQKQYSYTASEGFVVTDHNPTVIYPKEGKKTAIKIEGHFQKPLTNDDIRLQIVEIKRDNKQVIKWCKEFKSTETFDSILTASFELEAIGPEVDSMYRKHNFKIELSSDTNVTWNKIQWDARMNQYNEGNYTVSSTEKNTCSSTFVIENFKDSDFHEQYPYIDYKMFPKQYIEGKWHTVSRYNTNHLEVFPEFERSDFSNKYDADGTLTLAVKKADGTLLGKQEVIYENGRVVSSKDPLEVAAKYGDKIWIEYYTRDLDFVKNIRSSRLNSYTFDLREFEVKTCHLIQEPNCRESKRKLARKRGPSNLWSISDSHKFGPMYRNWGQFVYNGNPDRLNRSINENLLKGTEDKYINERDIPELPEGVKMELPEEGYTEEELLEINQNNPFKPEKEIFIEMVPKLLVEKDENNNFKDISPRWQGYDPENYVKREEVSTSRLGNDDIRPLSVQVDDMLTGIDEEIEEEIEEGTLCKSTGKIAIGVPKATWTIGQLGVALGMSAGPAGGSLTSSAGLTTQVLDYMDMNGDRYPDIVGMFAMQMTKPTGALSNHFVFYPGTSSLSSHFSAGITMGGSVSTAKSFGVPGGVGSSNGSKAKTEKQSKELSNIEFNASASFGLSGNLSANTENLMHVLVDVNGDGLPDRVKAGGIVQLNYGYAFSKDTNWNFFALQNINTLSVSGGAHAAAAISSNLGSGSVKLGVGASWSLSKTNYMLQDMNGDGLVDLVKDVFGKVYVSLNTGNTFLPEVEWAGATGIKTSQSFGLSGDLAFTVCVPILPSSPVMKICVNPSGGANTGLTKDTNQFIDIDGDGFMDVVESNIEGHLLTKRSTIARTNKLKTVQLPLGGSFTLDYYKSAATYDHPNGKWVMKSVEINDALHDDGPNKKTSYLYGKGKYDRNERKFLGFGKIITENLDTENNDAIYRKKIQEYDVSDYYKAGKLLSLSIEDAKGNPYTKEEKEYYVYSVKDTSENQYQFTIPTTTDEQGNKKICSDRGIGFIPVQYEKSEIFEGNQNDGIITKEKQYTYHLDNSFGEVKIYKYSDKGTLGKNGNGTYNYKTEIQYTHNPDQHILSLPIQMNVTDHNENVYRRIQASYNLNNGDITQVRQQLNDTDWAETDLQYDQYGNITKKTLPENVNGERMFYKYRYDRKYDMYVERVDDAYGYRTEFENFDYRYGIPLLTRDYNDYEIQRTLDEYGRVITVTGPNELADHVNYTIKNEYNTHIEKDEEGNLSQLAYSITSHYDPEHPNDDLETITYVDGLGRPVQVKKDATLTTVDDSGTHSESKEVAVASGRIKYDAFGREIEEYYPTIDDLSNRTKFKPNYDTITPTKKQYDVLDRITKFELPNNSKTLKTYSIDTNTKMIKTHVKDAEGSERASFKNGSGLIAKIEEYSGPKGTIKTEYEYNPINELSKVIDTQNNAIVIEYDKKGRRTKVEHPDAGITTFKYDPVGNKIEKQTANLGDTNQKITYDYEFTRLVGENYPEHPENNVRYYYGNENASHNRVGRIVLQEDAIGGQEFYYGRMGELTQVRRTLVIPNHAVATYVTKWRYDSWNRLQEMVYPDEEKITYSYNKGGLLNGITGEKTYTYNYINKIGYNKFEQRVYLKYCNGAETVYTYDPELKLLSALQVWDGIGFANDGTREQIINNLYTYDKVNNVLKVINDAQPTESNHVINMPSRLGGAIGGSMTHDYTYDGLHRLKTANGTFTGGEGKTAHYTLEMDYDNLHNIISKKQHHNQSRVSFDGQLHTGYDLNYTYDVEKPHQIINVEDDNYRTVNTNRKKIITNNHFYAYDLNGNVTEVNIGKTRADSSIVDNVNRRKIIWDENNRLEAISDNGFISNYWYDAKGDRVVKMHHNSEKVYVDSDDAGARTGTENFIAYVNPYFVVRNGGNYTKHIYMKDERVVSKLGDYESFGEDPRRIEYAGAEAEGHVMPNYEEKYKTLQQVIRNRFDSLRVSYHGLDNNDYAGGIGFCCSSSKEGSNTSSRSSARVPSINDNAELLHYYYHPDHLGSSSYITNLDGEVVQHVEYVPFGEVFIEERNNTWNTPYLFNSKELDEETGLYYYGARYYNPRMSHWLSVDPPIFDEYLEQKKEEGEGQNRGVYEPINLNVYNYTKQNPVKLVDPDGKAPVLGTIIRGIGAGIVGAGRAGANPARHASAVVVNKDKYTYTSVFQPSLVPSHLRGTQLSPAQIMRYSHMRSKTYKPPTPGALRDGKGYDTFGSFKSNYGKAGKGNAWHHIVEQNSYNISKFDPKFIHNTKNIIRIDNTAGGLHRKVTGYYNSKQPFTNGKTVREYLKDKSFNEQYNFGVDTLKKFGWNDQGKVNPQGNYEGSGVGKIGSGSE